MIISQLLIEVTSTGIITDWASLCPSNLKVPVFCKRIVELLVRLPDHVCMIKVPGTNYTIDRNDIESVKVS